MAALAPVAERLARRPRTPTDAAPACAVAIGRALADEAVVAVVARWWRWSRGRRTRKPTTRWSRTRKSGRRSARRCGDGGARAGGGTLLRAVRERARTLRVLRERARTLRRRAPSIPSPHVRTDAPSARACGAFRAERAPAGRRRESTQGGGGGGGSIFLGATPRNIRTRVCVVLRSQ